MNVTSQNYYNNETGLAPSKHNSKQTVCFKYSTQTSTSPTGRYNSSFSDILRVYRTGEIVLFRVCRNSQSKPPLSSYGTRLSTGITSHGRSQIRRAVASRVVAAPSKPVMLTLTTQEILEDRVFKRHLASFLDYAKKIASSTFKDYVKVIDLQQRGTLHSHLLLFERIPTDSFAKLRALWADKYELGPGSFDVKYLKGNAELAGAYLTHATAYLTREHDAIRMGRNGKPYVRTAFAGRAYSISTSLIKGALPIELTFPLSDARVHSLAKSLSWTRDGYSAHKQCDSFADAKAHLASFGITA